MKGGAWDRHGSATPTEAVRRVIPDASAPAGRKVGPAIDYATLNRVHCDDQLPPHLASFISARNFGKRFKTRKGLTPCEFICERWTIKAKKFTVNPTQDLSGLNTRNGGYGS